MKKLSAGFLLCVMLAFLYVPGIVLSAQEDPAGEPADVLENAELEAGTEGVAAEGIAVDTAASADTEAMTGDAEAEDAEGQAAAPVLSQEQRRIKMEIDTGTLTELAGWAGELGLGEGGTRDDIARRLYTHFGLPFSGAGDSGENQKVITIEAARNTEYFTLEVVNEEYARLSGNVRISLKDGEAVYEIEAGEILFNRTRNLLSASGGVSYRKQEGDTVETFRGQSIVIDLDNWAGTFMDGISERSLTGDDQAYRFEGEVISRTGEDVTVLRRARITNAQNKDSYWSINASKLWLLPGSDFAVFNAVLKVGEIPLLYFPFFFYPADKLIFHPVLGYRSREGSFLQTTTYLLGRPTATSSEENSITKILGNNDDMERKREGLFLRSTGKKVSDPNDTRLSLIFDAYTNLGVYLGSNLALPARGAFGAQELSFGLGLTRDIYQTGGVYTPYDSGGASNWNQGRFFSATVPLRYRFIYTGSVSGAAGSFNWSLPFYSDPYVNRDFLDRSEDMDLFNIMKQGVTTDSDLSSNLLGSYEWRVNYSVTPSLPALRPYVSALSISSLSSFVSFRTRTSGGMYNAYSPNHSFFFPDKFTLFSLSASVSGQPVNTASGTVSPASAGVESNAMTEWGLPRSPWDGAEDHAEAAPSSSTAAPPGAGSTGGVLVPPALAQNFNIKGGIGGPRLSLDYRLSPSASSEMQFRSSSANWKEADDVGWTEISSILTSARTSGSLTLTAGEASGFYTNALTFSGNTAWQGYTYMNEEAEEYTSSGAPDPVKINAAKLRNYQATYFTTSAELSSTVRPLVGSDVWSASSLNYSIRNLVAKSVFDGTGQDPSWHIDWGRWSKDTIEAHRLNANLDANVMDYRQHVSLSAELPPRDSSMTGNGTFNVWRSTTTVSGRVDDPFETSLWRPVTVTETVRLSDNSNMRYSMIYEPEEEEVTSLTAGLTYKNLDASFSAAKFVPYILNPTNGWELDPSGEAALHPRDFRLQYRHNLKNDSLFESRLGYSVDAATNLTLDLQRYTYSALTFSLSTTLRISDFMDATFTTRAENNQIIRYMQDIPYFNLPSLNTSGFENNPFLDLLNSFRFDDPELRRRSGYKLKDFSLVLTHYLGDWNAKLGVRLAPYLDQTVVPFTYKFNTEISFLIQWIPVSEFKTEVKYDKNVFDLL